MNKKDKEINKFLATAFKNYKRTTLSKKIERMLGLYKRKKNVSKRYNQQSMERLFPFKSIPETNYPVKDYIIELERKILPYGTNVSSPKFIGHMTSALPNFTLDVAKLIASLNQNVVKLETAQSATFYERQAIAMLHELLYSNTKEFYEKHIHQTNSTLGIVCSGGTIANLTSLQCARNLLYPQIEKKGLYNESKGVVLCSELGHYSIKKSMGLLGIGSDSLITIPTDDQNKICIDTLKKTIHECQKKQLKIIALIGIAGTTECGSIDPLDALAEIAEIHNIYFHVDAAWGGSIKFSETYAYLLKGIEKADSITIDGHKQLYLPMGIGLVLFKDPKMAALIEKQSEYIIRKTSIDLGKRSIEGSRPAHSFYLQAGFKLLGKKMYARLIEKGIENTNNMADYLDTLDDFELLTFPETNIFLYRYIPETLGNIPKTKTVNKALNTFNKILQKKQMEAGNSFVSYTTVPLKKYDRDLIVGLRIVLASPLVNKTDLKLIIEEQRKLAKDICLYQIYQSIA
ncbi:aminotransferase class V-fold PLP-dependent enzyme [Flavivirga jejuensis]|uniref:Aminotransferase class V-fold PLP-dependent enzyme n=1 Tax=Flavivirga jejuensis TaxID=870487 RepID=A0ABT8WP76_9FLAO|nr:aminotransferase class V-fold PLP-dependent enzyme [Flavivirga jejuensis]MDO5974933.1 aminotransferase class V-fold PLP-dependent enzyme [Flavivirga jejuensis]